MSADPTVSVIVPHYRDLKRLDLCLQALGRQTFSSGQVEIIVADNNSPEGEAAVAGVIAGRARLVIVQEKGAGPARNGGVALARGPIIAFTDSDCIPEPSWLEEGVKALSGYDFVGGAVRVLVDGDSPMSGAEAFERVFAFDVADYVARKGFAVTANLFCTQAMREQVGEFRVGVSEDVEWCLRAGRKGFHLGYAPAAIVGHPARRNWDELWSKWRRVNAETYSLYRERRGGRLLWFVRSFALPASAFIHAPRVISSKQLNAVDQRLSALGTLFKLRMWRMGDALRLLSEKRAG